MDDREKNDQGGRPLVTRTVEKYVFVAFAILALFVAVGMGLKLWGLMHCRPSNVSPPDVTASTGVPGDGGAEHAHAGDGLNRGR